MTIADAQQLLSSTFECVVISMPKTLENVAKLCAFLQAKLIDRKRSREQAVAIDGFSLYEVDGASYGREIYQERTITVRILVDRANAESDPLLTKKFRSSGARWPGASRSMKNSHDLQNAVIVRRS